MMLRKTDSIDFQDTNVAAARGVESGSLSVEGTTMNWVRGLSVRNMSALFDPAFGSASGCAPISASDGRNEKNGISLLASRSWPWFLPLRYVWKADCFAGANSGGIAGLAALS